MDAEKVRENRLRNTARRRGLILRKSRLRDHRAIGYGEYWIVDETSGQVVTDMDIRHTLDDIEDWLTRD